MTFEETQRYSAIELESHALTAKQWHFSGGAESEAVTGNAGFAQISDFIVDHYIPYRAHERQHENTKPLTAKVGQQFEKIASTLDRYIGRGDGDAAVDVVARHRRKNAMAFVNLCAIGGMGDESLNVAVRALNHVARADERDSTRRFTGEDVRDLLGCTRELHGVLRGYIAGRAKLYADDQVDRVSASPDNQPRPPSALGRSRLSSASHGSSPNSDRAPDASAASREPSPAASLIAETPPADQAVIIENPATPPSAQPIYGSPDYGPPLSMSGISAPRSPSRGISPNPERLSRASAASRQPSPAADLPAPVPQTPPANTTRPIESLATPPAMQPGKRHRSPEPESPETPTGKRQRLIDRPDDRSDATSI